jgi:hypothetical protein
MFHRLFGNEIYLQIFFNGVVYFANLFLIFTKIWPSLKIL